MYAIRSYYEGGARAGIIAPDEKTFAYLKGRPMAPGGEQWDQAPAGEHALARIVVGLPDDRCVVGRPPVDRNNFV